MMTTREPTILHRASWLVPVSSPPIEDGAVLVHGERIVSAGDYGTVRSQAPAGTCEHDHGSAALVPGLVNAHTHLELTGFAGLIPLPQPGFPAWLGKVFEHRSAFSIESMRRSIDQGLHQLTASGTAICGDINNGSCLEPAPKTSGASRHVFFEVLGFDRQGLTDAVGLDMLNAFAASARRSPAMSLAAHAAYSTSPEVIRDAKGWCRRTGRVFSIHAAEHAEEVEFLRSGRGFCRELLQGLGRWAARWSPPGMSALAYLDRLGVLDRQTLVVHAVHFDGEDWEIARRRGISVCFCPRSNHNLSAGPPDIPRALGLGLVAALGTDSLASNTDLDLFREAVFTLDQYPGLSPEAVLAMITLGGATAIGQAQSFGAIEAGKSSRLLAVAIPESASHNHLAESILLQGKRGAWKWVSSCTNV
ncbi:MAG: amidohydrolase family protein [Syntrophobacteraceae bacterium]|jgi:cytosine/adenosine deaminase-related metal-dependent hydrolase|nr:amidohydrolase family protein [Syntrophobacteraceae bacterium]MCU0589478.1 amidohydrolase family protein [Syntrophobacteraceae bacterium]